MNTRHPTEIYGQGFTAFIALRAEDEPFLADCYVRPAEFPLMAGARSSLVFGDSGAGNTALRLMLEWAWQDPSQVENWLLVRWRFNALAGAHDASAGSGLAASQQRQVFNAVARSLLEHLSSQSDVWSQAPDWTRKTLAWFIKQHIEDPDTFVNARIDEGVLSAGAVFVLNEILAAEDRKLLPSDAPPVVVMSELTRALPRIGLSGVRLLVEDVALWWETYPDQTEASLKALLSTLSLFENPAFAYMFLLPADLWRSLTRTTGVVRRRIQVFHLRWQESELVRIVETRLTLALGRSEATLADLVGPRTELLLDWLKGCGGSSPRGWLEAIRPFLAVYISRGESPLPLSEADCIEIRRRYPPIVRLDTTTNQVLVGSRHVGDLGLGHFAILQHLSEHAGKICDRKILYRVYQTASYPEYRERDVMASELASVLDTALYRLRASIEPIPANPVLLETVRGRGVRLRSPARD